MVRFSAQAVLPEDRPQIGFECVCAQFATNCENPLHPRQRGEAHAIVTFPTRRQATDVLTANFSGRTVSRCCSGVQSVLCTDPQVCESVDP